MIPPPSSCYPLDGFVEAFWAWWSAINPIWRKSDSRGRLELGHISRWVPRDKKARWGCLFRAGVNSMLSVVMALCWWSELLDPEDDIDDWQYAVRDVLWVLLQLRGIELTRYDHF